MGGSSGSKPKDLTPRDYRNLRAPVSGVLGNTLQDIYTNGLYSDYAGQLVAPMRGGEQRALDTLEQQTQPSDQFTQALRTLSDQAAGVRNPYATAAPISVAELFGLEQIGRQAFGGTATSGAQDALLNSILGGEGLSPESNPFLRASIDAATRPIIEQFGDQSNAVRGMFSQAGQFTAPGASSPFELANARLATGVANAIGDVGTNISFANYDAERNRQLQALSLAQTGDANAFTRALQATEALGRPREIQDTALQRQAAAFETSQDRAQSAATQIPALERSAVENTLTNLQAQALPRLIQEYGIQRGLQLYEQQQNSLLAILQLASQVSSPSTGQATTGPNGVGQGIGAALGGIAGAFIGGPAGATIGASAGGSIGGSI